MGLFERPVAGRATPGATARATGGATARATGDTGRRCAPGTTPGAASHTPAEHPAAGRGGRSTAPW